MPTTAEPTTPCDCESPGYFNSGIPGILAHIESDGTLAHTAAIERCDLCERYPDDEAAEAELLKHRKRAPPLTRCTTTYEFDITYSLPVGKSSSAVAAEFGRVLDELTDAALGSGFGGEISNCEDLSRGSFKPVRTVTQAPIISHDPPVIATLSFTDAPAQRAGMLMQIVGIYRETPGHTAICEATVCGPRKAIGRLLEQKSAVANAASPPHMQLTLPAADGKSPPFTLTLRQFLIASYDTAVAAGSMTVADLVQIYISVDDANLIAEKLYERGTGREHKESVHGQASEKAENDRPAAQA